MFVVSGTSKVIASGCATRIWYLEPRPWSNWLRPNQLPLNVPKCIVGNFEVVKNAEAYPPSSQLPVTTAPDTGAALGVTMRAEPRLRAS